MARAWTHMTLVAALGLLAACASAPRHATTQKTERASESAPYDFRTEGRVPPAETEVPVAPDVEEIPVTNGDLEVEEAEAPPPDTLRSPAPSDSMAEGFRIQVFATTDREVAENAARAAGERLGLPGYVDLEAGTYKVRVGDYVDRKAAEAALATVRSHYYPDAWIVPGRVRVPRKP